MLDYSRPVYFRIFPLILPPFVFVTMVYRAVERGEEGWACQEQGEQDPVVYHSASDGAISTTISNVSNSEDRERIKREYKGLSGI